MKSQGPEVASPPTGELKERKLMPRGRTERGGEGIAVDVDQRSGLRVDHRGRDPGLRADEEVLPVTAHRPGWSGLVGAGVPMGSSGRRPSSLREVTWNFEPGARSHQSTESFQRLAR